jgi:hypothetical protein
MKSKIPSTKYQTNLKFQYLMIKTKQVWNFEFGHWYLFDICELLFGISDTPR